jgi:hypothetical protein
LFVFLFLPVIPPLCFIDNHYERISVCSEDFREAFQNLLLILPPPVVRGLIACLKTGGQIVLPQKPL